MRRRPNSPIRPWRAWKKPASGRRRREFDEPERCLLSSLPPRSGGEGRFASRERCEAGWGVLKRLHVDFVVEGFLPSTPDPSSPLTRAGGGGACRRVMTDEILFERRGAAGVVTLNRPAALNAVTHGMVLRLRAQLEAWAADDAVTRVVVTANGERAFS